MRIINKLPVKTIILVVILAAVLLFLASGIRDVSVDTFRITGLEGLDTKGFTLSGELMIENPSRISVPVKDIEYDVVLNDTGETVSTGSIPPFTLKGRQVTSADFSQQINWAPAGQTVISLITQDEVYMDVVGNATVDVYGLTTYTLPFSKQVDIKEYINNFSPGSGDSRGSTNEVTGDLNEEPESSGSDRLPTDGII